MAAFARMGALSTRNDDPAAAVAPVRRRPRRLRDGRGRRRSSCSRHWEPRRRPRRHASTASCAGYGRTCDAAPHHRTRTRTAPAPSPACEQALADAGLEPGGVGHINAHGTSTPLNDAAEAEAIAKVFGAGGPPVTSTKGVTGHLVGAAGAVEAVIGLAVAPRDGLVPPVANLTDPDPASTVDLVRGEPARRSPPAPVVSNSFGFGGHNADPGAGPRRLTGVTGPS